VLAATLTALVAVLCGVGRLLPWWRRRLVGPRRVHNELRVDPVGLCVVRLLTRLTLCLLVSLLTLPLPRVPRIHATATGAPSPCVSRSAGLMPPVWARRRTYRSVNNKFSVKYYVNLVLVDEDDRRYFKQSEINLRRASLVD